MRVSAEQPTAGSASFVRNLPTRWQQPPILGPLGHDVRTDAPSGLVPDVARTADPVHGQRPELIWPSVQEPVAELPAVAGGVSDVSRGVWPTPSRMVSVVAPVVAPSAGTSARSAVASAAGTVVVPAAGTGVASAAGTGVVPAAGTGAETGAETGVAPTVGTGVRTGAVPAVGTVVGTVAAPVAATGVAPVAAPAFAPGVRTTVTPSVARVSQPVAPTRLPVVEDVAPRAVVTVTPSEPDPVGSVVPSQEPESEFVDDTEEPDAELPQPAATSDIRFTPTPVIPQAPSAPAPAEKTREQRPGTRRTRLGPPITPPAEPKTVTAPTANMPTAELRHVAHTPDPEVTPHVEATPPSIVPDLPQNTTTDSPSRISPSPKPLPTESALDDLRSDSSTPPIPTAMLPTQAPVTVPDHAPQSILTTVARPRPADIAPIVSQRRLLTPSRPISATAPLNHSDRVDSSNVLTPLSALPAPPPTTQAMTTTRIPTPAPPTSAPDLTNVIASKAAIPAPAGSSPPHAPPDQPAAATPIQFLTAEPPATPAAPHHVSAQNPPTSAPAPAPTSTDPFALDQLAADLYDRLRSRLVDELYVGRERAQLLTDL